MYRQRARLREIFGVDVMERDAYLCDDAVLSDLLAERPELAQWMRVEFPGPLSAASRLTLLLALTDINVLAAIVTRFVEMG